jgi:hypothetical protein
MPSSENRCSGLSLEVEMTMYKTANCVLQETKVVVYKTIYSPILMYGCESWALTIKLEIRLQSNDMRYPRSVAGKTRRDRMRNSTRRMGLNIEPLVARIKYVQLRWFGHIQRMQEGRCPKEALEARSEGRRPKGRRREVQADNIVSLLKERKCTWQEAVIRAQDRVAWRTLCSASTPKGRRGSD